MKYLIFSETERGFVNPQGEVGSSLDAMTFDTVEKAIVWAKTQTSIEGKRILILGFVCRMVAWGKNPRKI